jgi:CRISPR associated protein, Cas1 family
MTSTAAHNRFKAPVSCGTPASAREDAASEAQAIAARPLYLMSPGGCVVDIDGPALKVRRKQRPDVRYPLSRISRIVSAASVEWKAKALVACLGMRIPVVLLNTTGALVGYVQPVSCVRSSLDAILSEFLDRADWRGHHGNWLRAERMRAVRYWAWSRKVSENPVDEPSFREAVRRFVYTPEGSSEGSVASAGIYRAALMALACEKLSQAGACSTYVGINGTELHLARDLCDLLEIALALELSGMGSHARMSVREHVLVVEAFTDQLEHRCSQILGRLHRHARELLREWR